MMMFKIELLLAVFHLSFCAINVVAQDSLPHLAEQPTCIALDIIIACSHVFFAGHKIHDHFRNQLAPDAIGEKAREGSAG